VVDVLLPCAAGTSASAAQGEPPILASLSDESAEAHVLPMRLSSVCRLSAARLWLPTSLATERDLRHALHALRQLLVAPERLGSASKAEAACLHPLHHLGATEAECVELMAQADELAAQQAEIEAEMTAEIAAEADHETDEAEDGAEHSGAVQPSDAAATANGAAMCEVCEAATEGAVAAKESIGDAAAAAPAAPAAASTAAVPPALDAYASVPPLDPSATLEARLCRLRRRRQLEASAVALSAAGLAQTTDEFGDKTRIMRTVLRQLQHVDEENVVLLKGRAAAEVEATDELLAAELLLDGTFNQLSPAAAVALCACLVAADSEKVKRAQTMHADLAPSFELVQIAAKALARVMSEAGMPTPEGEYAARFDGGMVNVVYAWANGASFESLTGMCDLFEGSIIRVIRRLSELLDELQSAAKAVGNDELYKKLDDGAKLIRRDIVFAASLYIEA